MSNDGMNADRRHFLVAAISVAGATEAVGTTVPLVGPWFPGAKAKAAGVSVQVNVGKTDPGQQIITEQRGKPVFIVCRTKEMLDALPSLEGQLVDPDSKASGQSECVDPRPRSIKPELAMIVGIRIHLGCLLTFRPEITPVDLGPDWKGGYPCPCHGSYYDLVGRVCRGQLAPLGPPIPPYMFDADDVITISVDQEEA